MSYLVQRLADKVINGGSLSYADAEGFLDIANVDLPVLLSQANRIRTYFRKDKISLCSITNAKSGSCSQDCKFCAQSANHKTGSPRYPLITPAEMLNRARRAVESKTERFCLVTSGGQLSAEEFADICRGLILIKKEFPGLKLDASLGKLTLERAQELKQAGLSRYNHNLETVASYFSKICTTHTFQDRLETVRLLKKSGLEVCCGGIFGLGETSQQRLELGFALRQLDVDCIPINLLNPIAGTPLEKQVVLDFDEIFKMIAIFRFIHPKKEIKICGGRQAILKDRQSQIFSAGADSIILGDYLTTKGSLSQDDFAMIESLGLRV
jgi:biotin synthase